MDKEGPLGIGCEEMKDQRRFQPSANMYDIIKNWRNSANLQAGEELRAPDDLPLEKPFSGTWWRHLVADSTEEIHRFCSGQHQAILCR